MAFPSSWQDPQVVADLTDSATNSGSNFKALVCIFLLGGNDSHNTVIPLTGTRRAQYDVYRSSISVVNSTPSNTLDADWRLHPSLTTFKTLWDLNKLAVVHGIGSLIEPTTKAQYQASTTSKPDQLFSHNSQVSYWQGLPPDGSLVTEGWMGRADELLSPYFNSSRLSASTLSILGNPTMLRGYESQPSTLTKDGATQLVAYSATGSTMLSSGAMQRSREVSPRNNTIQNLTAARNSSSVASQQLVNSLLAPLPTSTDARFTGHASYNTNPLLQQLRSVARSIYSASAFGHRRQFFYTGFGTFDTHANQLVDHAARLTQLNDAVSVFWAALGDLGLQNNVTTFTNTDFSRTFVQNGSGTDHAWASTQFVLGGAVTGGHYGTPPDYTVGGSSDVGAGRFIPNHPVEQMVGSLLAWMGLPIPHLHLVTENIAKFPQRTLVGMI